MDRRIRPRSALLLLVIATLLSVLPAHAKRKTGDIVKITGQVLDRQGRPVDGIVVVLEAAKAKYSLLRRQKIVEPALRQTAPVDAQGRFELEWHWDHHFNEFAISTALEVTRANAPDFEILSRTDLTDRMLSGAPVHVALTVEQAGYVRWLKRYLADRASADEEKTYRELGRPDRIEDLDGDSSWWYFKLGKAYHFESGRLDQVSHFDPMDSQ